MNWPRRCRWTGLALIACAAILYVYLMFLDTPASGAHGGGLSGLSAGLAILAAMILAGLGVIVAIVGLIAGWLKKP